MRWGTKTEQSKENQNYQQFAILNSMVSIVFTEKVMFQKRYKE